MDTSTPTPAGLGKQDSHNDNDSDDDDADDASLWSAVPTQKIDGWLERKKADGAVVLVPGCVVIITY